MESEIRECIPIRTFSSAVMLANSRMFWNVRQMPNAVIWSGRRPSSGSPLNRTSPDSGR